MLVSDLPIIDLLKRSANNVLILVLVDVGLGRSTAGSREIKREVLILVLVDVGLGHSSIIVSSRYIRS